MDDPEQREQIQAFAKKAMESLERGDKDPLKAATGELKKKSGDNLSRDEEKPAEKTADPIK